MKNLSTIIKTIGITALFAGVSVVSAWNAPTGTAAVKTAPRDGDVAAAINTGIFDQIKKGGIFSQKTLVSPLSFFKKEFLPGNSATVRVGSGGSSDVDFATAATDPNYQSWVTRKIPLTIDLTGRAQPTNAIEFKSGQVCPTVTRLINTNAPTFEFWNEKAGEQADLIAKQVKLVGGNPAPGKILISVDNNGRGVWATPKLAADGKTITFDPYGDSPVGICGTVTPPVVHTCPAGQSWDDTQNTCLCDGGIREGQTPNTNVVQTGKIIEYINTVNQNPGGSNAPIVPYYVLLEELRRGGGQGNSCQIKAFDTACPLFNLDTVNNQNSFTFDGVTFYQTRGGDSWRINSTVGDQCIMNQQAQVNGQDLIMYNIE